MSRELEILLRRSSKHPHGTCAQVTGAVREGEAAPGPSATIVADQLASKED
jgi:hypothetical protein